MVLKKKIREGGRAAFVRIRKIGKGKLGAIFEIWLLYFMFIPGEIFHFRFSFG